MPADDRFRQLVGAVLDAIVVADRQGAITFVNRGAPRRREKEAVMAF